MVGLFLCTGFDLAWLRVATEVGCVSCCGASFACARDLMYQVLVFVASMVLVAQDIEGRDSLIAPARCEELPDHTNK